MLTKKNSLFGYLVMSIFFAMFEKKNHLESLQFLNRFDKFIILSQINFVITHNFIRKEWFYCLPKKFIIDARFLI